MSRRKLSSIILASFCAAIFIAGIVDGPGNRGWEAVVWACIAFTLYAGFWFSLRWEFEPSEASPDCREVQARGVAESIPRNLTDALVAECVGKLMAYPQELIAIIPILKFVSQDPVWRSTAPLSLETNDMGVLYPYLSGVDLRTMDGAGIMASCRTAIAGFLEAYDDWTSMKAANVLAATRKSMEAEEMRQEADVREQDSLGRCVIGGWVVLMILGYFIERGRPEFGSDIPESLPARIRAGLDATLSALPPDAAWNHRAAVGTLVGVVAFALMLPLSRMVSRSWPVAAACAAAFSFGILQIGEVNVFTFSLNTCEAARSGLSSSATLTTEEMNAFDRLKCSLPSGFAMDRDMHRVMPAK